MPVRSPNPGTNLDSAGQGKSLAELVDLAEALGRNEPGGRVEPPVQTGELDRLARALDSIAQNLAAHRLARAELDDYTRDLIRSNEELEQFAYTASHDLQEPLRKIASFTGLLEKKYGHTFDKQAGSYMRHVVDGAWRMKTLIEALLDYSRAGRGEFRLEQTELSGLVDQALATLESLIEATGAEITIGPLPNLEVEPILLGQVFVNLIGNALKFHGPQPPRINLEARRREREWIIAVRDNGLGIPAAEQDKIFQAFHKVHHRTEYRGAGIGLAVCKKIIERHGGNLWLESREGRGTTFLFSLPEAES